MISPAGIIPENLMAPRFKADVIAFLKAQPYTGEFKEKLLLGWAVWVGINLRRADYNAVFKTGVEPVNG